MVKSLNSKTNSIPILVSETPTAASNVDKANLLNATFVSNFNYSLPGLTGQFLSDAPHSCPTDLLCTEDEVYNMLSTLDTTKANGHDDISARMLRETATSVTPYVMKLFNTSITRLGELPDEWKVVRVTPIPKSGNRSDPGNYRPISLLSILSKLLETHIHNILLKHFEEKYPLS